MAAHSSTLAWKIPWAEETGGLWSMGSLRVGHDWSDFTFTFHFHPLEKEMATHSSTLAGRIPGSAEPDGLPSMGSHRVGHDWSDLAATLLPCLRHKMVSILQLKKKNTHTKKEVRIIWAEKNFSQEFWKPCILSSPSFIHIFVWMMETLCLGNSWDHWKSNKLCLSQIWKILPSIFSIIKIYCQLWVAF